MANRDMIEGAGLFIAQLEQPVKAALTGLRPARGAGVASILNPAPAADLSDELLSLVDIITPNESEAEGLTSLPVAAQPQAAADALIKRGVGAAIITLGEKGVLYCKDGQSLHVPARAPALVRDTTGTGNAFNGFLAVALSEGRPMAEALRFGCVVAGISLTRTSAAASTPTRTEVEAFLAS
jgi:ribokinase